MPFKSVHGYQQFVAKTRYDQRYIHDKEVKQFLSEVLRTCTNRKRDVKTGKIVWRAQLGNEWRPHSEEVGEVPSPYSPERMTPLSDMASEGRINPKGMPCLYLATDKETAMSEVRPWIGSNISVGQFRIEKDLIVIDCSVNANTRNTMIYFEEPDDEEKERVVWSEIDQAFSAPVIPSDQQADYVPTQIIAELFKSKDYDGVVYKSLLGTGLNIALFNLQAAKIANCHLFEAKDVCITFEECANPYFVDPQSKQIVENRIIDFIPRHGVDNGF